MSGFGGSFGFGQTAAPPPFGSQTATSSSGFGAPSGAFGGGNFVSAPPLAGGSIGSPSQSQASFGSSPPPSMFGTANDFGSLQPFGVSGSSSTSTFGASPNLITSGFGQPSTGSGTGNRNAVTGAVNNFSSGYGYNSTSSIGFNSFGANNRADFGSTSSSFSFNGATAPSESARHGAFGAAPSTGPFVNGAFSTDANNPFGAPTTGSTSNLIFGSSSNVVVSSAQGMTTEAWGAPVPFATSSASAFGSASTSAFAGSAFVGSGDVGMQQHSDNEDMADGSISPFGRPSFPLHPPADGASRNLSPVPVEAPMTDSTSPMPHESDSFGANSRGEEFELKAKMEEKKRLQAQIEEKKRKLLERQLKKAQGKESSLSADAAPYVPTASTSAETSTAQRNVPRFSTQAHSSSERSQRPFDLRDKVDRGLNNGNDVQKESNREHLEHAVSLVGTCPNMCPEEELERRGKEGDIQQLEIPQPGILHPPDWTLRNTAVKRFRRSAADYKLDIPEWVRPPDVLEKVCAYLEEWVMVSEIRAFALHRRERLTVAISLGSRSAGA